VASCFTIAQPHAFVPLFDNSDFEKHVIDDALPAHAGIRAAPEVSG